MPQRIIGLSGPLQSGVPADRSGCEVSIESMGHKGTIDRYGRVGLRVWIRKLFLTEQPVHWSTSGSRLTSERTPMRKRTRDRRGRTGSHQRRWRSRRSSGPWAGGAGWISTGARTGVPRRQLMEACSKLALGPFEIPHLNSCAGERFGWLRRVECGCMRPMRRLELTSRCRVVGSTPVGVFPTGP